MPESNWDTELGRTHSPDYHVNNMSNPVRFHEAVQHIPANAIVLEVAPHALLQSVLRRSLPKTCTIIGLTDKRQPDNFMHFLSSLGKYVCLHVYSNKMHS